VADVSFEVARGEIFALLGPNGAGKTTLIRMLVGLTHPDRGTIRYELPGGGAPLMPPGRLGYLPEERGLYQDVEVLRTLEHFGVLRGMERSAATRSAQSWLERLALGDRMREPLKALSKGNQQKVQFISAVLHDPAFALLDEPFSGLDPLNQDLFLTLLRELRDAGATVLLSAHQMQLVERVADRIIVMDRGSVVLGGTLDEIRRRWRPGSKLVVRTGSGGMPDLEFLRSFEPDVTAHVRDGAALELFVREDTPLGPLLAALAERLDIRAIESHPLTLHDVYVGTVAGASAGIAQALPS
jgi:ABC-2 type transport system ATP-binding protein